MVDPAGNAPAISRVRLVLLIADEQSEVARDEVPGLLVRMRVAREQRALAQAKLGHHCSHAMRQSFPLDSFQCRMVAVLALWFEHEVEFTRLTANGPSQE